MSVAVDGAQRYVWPVSTGRPGYDTPSGTFKRNRMDADHYSQECDNAPMPHAIFFDMDGHAIHGFFDVKHLGSAVSHGCVRLSPDHARTLFNLVKAGSMSETKVVVAGRTPGGDNAPVARSRLPLNETVSSEPTPAAPGYGRDSSPYYSDRSYAQPVTSPATLSAPMPGRIRASRITGSRITPSRATRRRLTYRNRRRSTGRQVIGSGDALRLANGE